MKSATQNTSFSKNKTLNIQGELIDLAHPRVMGILNVTPDSFFDGGQYIRETALLNQVEKMITDGATFIDIGGYSSRPGAAEVPVGEELRRVTSAVRAVVRAFPGTFISVDTFRSAVAAAAIAEGAGMINDISAGELDKAMIDTIAELKVPYIVMHMRGTPQNMNEMTDYADLIKDITDYFHQKLYTLQQAGIYDTIIDPGFGFAKTVQQNFELLHHLDYFNVLERPLLAGLSRKSLIWRTLNITPEEALNGTTALNTVALLKGASILRVHDVKEAVEIIRLIK